MSKPIVRLASGLLIMLVIIGGLVGCSSKLPEPDYAGQITETSLQAMSNCDYAAYLANFTPAARAAVTEAVFDPACQQIKDAIGDYIDKEFWKAETENSYTVVYYTASYSDEPDEVIVTVYFEEIEGEMLIAGFWLSSPKLEAMAESGSQ
jgi:hypothetical protein